MDDLRRERQSTQDLIKERDQAFLEQKNWIAELEAGKKWWEQQTANWQTAAEARDREIMHLRAWVEELERAKKWWEKQSATWQALAEEREANINQRNSVPERRQD